jgi:hypothetical protein
MISEVVAWHMIKTYTLARWARIERRHLGPQQRTRSTRHLGATDNTWNGDWHRRLARAKAHVTPFLQTVTSAPHPGLFVVGLNIGSGHRISLGNLLASIAAADGIAVTTRLDGFRWKR